MTLLEATKKVMKATNHGTDAFTHDDYTRIRLLSGDCREDIPLGLAIVNLRKKGKIGPILGGKGPIKIADVVCPHCGKRNGGGM